MAYSQALGLYMKLTAGQRTSTWPLTVTTKSMGTRGLKSVTCFWTAMLSQMLSEASGEAHQSTEVPLKSTYLTIKLLTGRREGKKGQG